MKTLTIRNVPHNLYAALAELAERNGRSIQQQLLILLDRARLLQGDPPSAKAAKIRQKLKNRQLGDSVAEVRSERHR